MACPFGRQGMMLGKDIVIIFFFILIDVLPELLLPFFLLLLILLTRRQIELLSHHPDLLVCRESPILQSLQVLSRLPRALHMLVEKVLVIGKRLLLVDLLSLGRLYFLEILDGIGDLLLVHGDSLLEHVESPGDDVQLAYNFV